jgi:mono/diheme cytochrome c family protein
VGDERAPDVTSRAVCTVVAMTLMAACSRHTETAAPSRAPASSSDGGALYLQHCSSCHGTDGSGMSGVFPPLAGDPAVTGDSRRAIVAVARGERGRIVVNGVAYDGVMPGWSGDLSDEQIAAIVTYVRGAFHNHAPPVSAADVANASGR